MSQKPEYYSVLGVPKTATLDEIKKAYQKGLMKYHPDRQKTEEEKKAARPKFEEVENAYKILSDNHARATYDNYGHDGLDRLAKGQSAGTGRSFRDLAGPTARGPVDPEAAMRAFDKGGDLPDIPRANVPVDRAAAAEARRRAREAKRGGSGIDTILREITAPPPSTTPAAPRAPEAAKPAPVNSRPAPVPVVAAPVSAPKTGAGDFEDAARDVRSASEKLGNLGDDVVQVPLAVLESFRDNVREMLSVLDAAIARGSKPGSPRR